MPGIPRELTAITVIVALQLALRGADYVTGNPKGGKGVFEVPDPSPPFVWGATCLVVAAVVAVGLIRRNSRVVRNAAVVAASVYGAFAIMVFDDAVRDGLDDWRFCTSYLTGAAVWGVIAYAQTMHIAVVASREGDSGDK